MSVEDETPEDYSSFPIPRMRSISDPKPAIAPSYTPSSKEFSPELFQLFFSLVNFHLPAYDLGQNLQFTPALETVGTAFEQEKSPSPRMQEHIVRKFLIECQHQLIQLTSKPVLNKIAMLHNELSLAAEFMRLHKKKKEKQRPLLNFCDMLMAEAYDVFNSEFSRIVNQQYWGAGKTAEEVINDLLKKEIEKLRVFNNKSFECLSQCAIKRSIESSPAGAQQKILSWAKDNDIPLG